MFLTWRQNRNNCVSYSSYPSSVLVLVIVVSAMEVMAVYLYCSGAPNELLLEYLDHFLRFKLFLRFCMVQWCKKGSRNYLKYCDNRLLVIGVEHLMAVIWNQFFPLMFTFCLVIFRRER
uniref:Uncharacterized protein n=1 Tax=Schistocephalus solidus TaxID=70667 RepID=A0A0X3NGT2_SCHSO